MYIHLGNNFIISSKKIISMLNIVPLVSKDIKEIIELARTEKKLIKISEKGKEKTLVICDDKVYISPISSNTLFKRTFK